MNLSDISLFDQHDLEILSNHGVRNTFELVRIVANTAQRRRLAETTTIDEHMLLRAALIADLAQLEGIGPRLAALFEACPQSRTVAKLAESDSEDLHVALQSVNSELHLVRRVPNVGQLRRLKEHAERVRPLIPIKPDSKTLDIEWRRSNRELDAAKIAPGCISLALTIIVPVVLLAMVSIVVLSVRAMPSEEVLPWQVEEIVQGMIRRLTLGMLKMVFTVSTAFFLQGILYFAISRVLPRIVERRLTSTLMRTAQQRSNCLLLLGPAFRVWKLAVHPLIWIESLTTISLVASAVPISIVALGLVLSLGSIRDASWLRTFSIGFIVMGSIAVTLLMYAPRFLYFCFRRRRKNLLRWSEVFERKWLSLWFLTSATNVLTMILAITTSVFLVAWSLNVGTLLFEQSVNEMIVQVEEEVTQLVESGQVETRGPLEEFIGQMDELQEEFHRDGEESRKYLSLLIKGVGTAAIPAIISVLCLEMAYHILVAALSGQWRILARIGIQAGVSLAIGLIASEFAERLGIGSIGLMALVYGVLVLVTDALIPDYVYGFIWERAIPCPYCETDVQVIDKFCSSCGFMLSK